jgi:hypothetical protein
MSSSQHISRFSVHIWDIAAITAFLACRIELQIPSAYGRMKSFI